MARLQLGLATIYYYQENPEKYAPAESLIERALATSETVLGPDHADVGGILVNLGDLKYAEGKYTEAEPIQRRALEIYESALGVDHHLVGEALNNLANTYLRLSRPADAEPLLQRAVRISEAHLGPDHSDVAVELNGLGVAYLGLGKLTEADSALQRALTIQRRLSGPDYPEGMWHMAETLTWLAKVQRAMGRTVEADSIDALAQAIREQQEYLPPSFDPQASGDAPAEGHPPDSLPR